MKLWRKARRRVDDVIVDYRCDDERELRLLSLKIGDAPPRVFRASLVLCESPACDCHTINLICVPDEDVNDEPAPPEWRIGLDLETRRATTPLLPGGEPDVPPAAIAAGLRDEHWDVLATEVCALKRSAMEDMDLDTLDVTFPPSVMAGKDTMVGYGEMFPFAETFPFNIDADRWIVLDQYCVAPDCDCHSAAIAFLRVPPNHNPRRVLKAPRAPSGHYDYVDGSFAARRPPRRKMPGFDHLLAALRTAWPGFGEKIKERHRQLRYLFKRVNGLLPKKEHVTAAASRKPGRNEPCPCGSGKKYKRCCGA